MSDPTPRRKLAAILAADVVGFSRMMGESEDRTLKNLKACRAIVDESVVSKHGRIFNTAGDSVIAEFASPVDAIVAAIEFQKSLAQRNEACALEDRMLFRVGLNLGDVIVEGDNLYGDGVNIAARIEAECEPGGVMVSAKFHEEVRRKLELSFDSLGEKQFKNIAEPISTFRVRLNVENKVQDGQNLPLTAPPSNEKPPSIAVLPFVNMSTDPEQEYLADGITEDIISKLSAWKNFPVVSRNSSFSFKGKNLKAAEFARELGVRYLVEGSVRKSGDRVRITANLIDAEDDQQIWSQRWDRTLVDIFDVQDEVSLAIAGLVSPALRGQEQKRLLKTTSQTMSAWEEYLRALNLHNTGGKFADIEAHCVRSFELDSNFADSYFLYIKALMSLRLRPEAYSSLPEIIDKVSKAAKHLQAVDPQRPETLKSLASLHSIKKEYSEAEKLTQKVLEANPYDADAAMNIGSLSAHNADWEKSIKYWLLAFELDPVLQRKWGRALALVYVASGNLKDGCQLIEKSFEGDSSDSRTLGHLAFIYGLMDNKTKAAEFLARYLEMRPEVKTADDYANIMPAFIQDKTRAGMRAAGMN